MVKKFSRILICPLQWGMGHATRSVPVINQLLDRKADVIIAAEGSALDFLRLQYPDLAFVPFPGVKVTYPTGGNMLMKLAMQIPSILSGIWKEHRALSRIIRDHQIDAVISDNRFGLWSGKTYSVYITHQLMIKAPKGMRWLEPWLHRAHSWFIRQYDECWVPDMPGKENLSGDLGHQYPLPPHGHFIGLLSRFGNIAEPLHSQESRSKTDLLVMLSGPEPQRTILERIILEELRTSPFHSVSILRGLPGKSEKGPPLPGVTMYNHLPDEEICNMIRQAGTILCRPGYSTLMDLVSLGRNAVLVPTPGQTEQEYLANYLSGKGLFAQVLQKDLSLLKVIEASRQLPVHTIDINDRELLADRIDGLPDKITFDRNSFNTC